MKPKNLPPLRPANQKSLSFFSLSALLISMAFCLPVVRAQQAQAPTQLSLADILIGLRSKKATIVEKNKLLTDAARERGITFALTPEIEKELANTGADTNLISALRSKSTVAKAEPALQPKTPVSVLPSPVSSQRPQPDFAFYQTSAREHFAKGELEPAIVDFTKAIELNPKDMAVYLNRGLAYYNQKKYDLAILDYSKAAELSPKNSNTYFKRGDAYEKSGDNLKAIADYQKSVELDAANETAKTALQRLQAAEQVKALPPPAPIQSTQPIPVKETPKIPETVELGLLNEMAVKMVTPIYPPIAQKSNIQGLVTVQIALDKEGKVVSAKATAGPMMLRSAAEDAARRSKFKPATVQDQAVKATGFVNYNFKM